MLSRAIKDQAADFPMEQVNLVQELWEGSDPVVSTGKQKAETLHHDQHSLIR